MHDALKKLEHDKTTRVKYEEVLAIMETELYNKAASSCKDERSNNMIKWVVLCVLLRRIAITPKCLQPMLNSGEDRHITAMFTTMALLILQLCLSTLWLVHRFMAMFIIFVLFSSTHHVIIV